MDHDTYDLSEQDARKSVVWKASADQEAEALLAIQQNRTYEVSTMRELMRGCLPVNAAEDLERETYYARLATVGQVRHMH